MNSIDTIICLMLLLMAVPDICRYLGRPALCNVFFVVFGLMLEPFVQAEVKTMLEQAGEVGFLLVLLEVGIEIELPPLRDFLPSLSYALGWSMVQYLFLLPVAHLSGLNLRDSLLAAGALSGCSISMAYPGWKCYDGLSGLSRDFVLQIMIALEVLTIVILTVGGAASKDGLTWWITVRLAGMALTIFLISRFASHVTRMFQWIILKTTRWRVHFLVLLVLVICAVGGKLGLAAPKTAFFLGLFMARTHFQGKGVEDYIAPISRGFLIPVFFMSLGLLVDPKLLFTETSLLAVGCSVVLLGFREVLHRRWFKTGGDRGTFLLFCPNLTMSALAANTLFEAGRPAAATWVVLSGLSLTVFSICLLPKVKQDFALSSGAG